jgi:hypothetical protein
MKDSDPHLPKQSVLREPEYSLPVPDDDVSFNRGVSEPRFLYPGSRIVTIKDDFARQANARAYPTRSLKMTGANNKLLSTGH